MTRTEVAALKELDMDPESLAQRTAAMDEIARIPKPNGDAIMAAQPKPPKKRRSDAGVPRKKPAPAPAPAIGKLTDEQSQAGLDLMRERDLARTRMEAAEATAEELERIYEEFDAKMIAWFRDHTA